VAGVNTVEGPGGHRYVVGRPVQTAAGDDRVAWPELDELVAERFGVGPRVRPGARVWEPTDTVGDLRRRLLRAAEGLDALRRAHPELARDLDRLQAAVWPDNRREIAARRRVLCAADDESERGPGDVVVVSDDAPDVLAGVPGDADDLRLPHPGCGRLDDGARQLGTAPVEDGFSAAERLRGVSEWPGHGGQYAAPP